MANNPVVNTLTFAGSVAGQATVQSQGIAGGLTFLLPNTTPVQGQLLTAQMINGVNVFLGWASPNSTSISLSQILPSGATSGQTIIFNGTNWVPSTGLPGEGTVTSVALTAPVEFTVGGSPITSSGTLAITKANQSANTVWAGPTTGVAAAPAFRALVAADIPFAAPQTIAAVTHNFLTSYTAGTGVFTAAQPVVADVTGAAPLASPALTGVPTAPTAAALNDSTQIATTAYTDSAVAVETTRATGVEATKAPLASPTFTGLVTLANEHITGTLADGTNSVGTNGQVLSSTGTGTLWITDTESVTSVFTRTGAVTAQSGDYSVGQVTGAAPLASPTFTGTVTTAAISATSVQASTFVAVTGNLDLSSGHGHIVQNTDIAGQITITNPATSGSFNFVGTYAAPPVAYVTPTSDPSTAGIVSYWVTTTTGAITVHVNTTPGTSIVFNYLTLGN